MVSSIACNVFMPQEDIAAFVIRSFLLTDREILNISQTEGLWAWSWSFCHVWMNGQSLKKFRFIRFIFPVNPSFRYNTRLAISRVDTTGTVKWYVLSTLS